MKWVYFFLTIVIILRSKIRFYQTCVLQIALSLSPMVKTIGYQTIRRYATFLAFQFDHHAKCHRHDLSGSLRFQPWANRTAKLCNLYTLSIL